MDIEDLQKSWDKLGKMSPLRSILPWYMKNKEWNIDELFAEGRREIALVIEYIKSQDVNFSWGKALDFGCGIGRLTQGLAPYFDEIYGVDIAPSMIELANNYNVHGDKCKYYVNERDDLKLFPNNNFDFIFSYNTFQNIKPKYSKKYIIEFVRLLAPNGLIVFQTSEKAKTIKGVILRILPQSLLNIRRRMNYGVELYSMNRKEILILLEQSGATIVDIKQDQRAAGKNWVSFRYCVTKCAV